MSPNCKILDTNAVLRFVLNDIAEQNLAVMNEIETADCIIPVEIIAEMVYVLEKYYHFTHDEIALVIECLIAYKDGLVERSDIVAFGAQVFASTKLDWMPGYIPRQYNKFPLQRRIPLLAAGFFIL
jgi:predicted nucleic-acid-binding protein